MITRIDKALRAQVNRFVAEEWSGPTIVSRGVAHDTSISEGFACMLDGALAGFALYNIEGGRCELLVLQSLIGNRGVGSALANAVIDEARRRGCVSVWLITTNDNMHAIRFYQRFGFELVALHIGAVAEARRIKPSIPLIGCDDIPVKHELEFSYRL